MASLDIGGDDSVMWVANHSPQTLEHRHGLPRRSLHKAHPRAHAMNVRLHEGYAEGRDPVDSRGKAFRISIKLPANRAARAAFLKALKSAKPTKSGKVNLKLPIEKRNHDQIHVEWAS